MTKKIRKAIVEIEFDPTVITADQLETLLGIYRGVEGVEVVDDGKDETTRINPPAIGGETDDKGKGPWVYMSVNYTLMEGPANDKTNSQAVVVIGFGTLEGTLMDLFCTTRRTYKGTDVLFAALESRYPVWAGSKKSLYKTYASLRKKLARTGWTLTTTRGLYGFAADEEGSDA